MAFKVRLFSFLQKIDKFQYMSPLSASADDTQFKHMRHTLEEMTW